MKHEAKTNNTSRHSQHNTFNKQHANKQYIIENTQTINKHIILLLLYLLLLLLVLLTMNNRTNERLAESKCLAPRVRSLVEVPLSFVVMQELNTKLAVTQVSV